jgi:hypothetical protein
LQILLVGIWAHKERSIREVALDALQNVADGMRCWLLEEMAEWGAKNKQNGARSFKAMLRHISVLQVYESTIPKTIRNDDGTFEIKETPHYVLWPFDVMHLLSERGKLEETIADLPEHAAEQCLEFWKQSSSQAWVQDIKRQSNVLKHPERVAPFTWHVDGVKAYKTQKVWAVSWSSSCRKGPSLKTKMIFSLVMETSMVPKESLRRVAHNIGYATDVLMSGVWPSLDEFKRPFPAESWRARLAGRPFAKGWRGAFSSFRPLLQNAYNQTFKQETQIDLLS